MRLRKLYPITLSMLSEHPKLVKKIFLKVAPHKGAYIGTSELEGSFMCDSPEELFESLKIGEKLTLYRGTDKPMRFNRQLEVHRADGTCIGMLDFSESIIPNMLYNRGIDSWCHLEAKELNGGMLAIAVSIYCEEY